MAIFDSHHIELGDGCAVLGKMLNNGSTQSARGTGYQNDSIGEFTHGASIFDVNPGSLADEVAGATF